MPNLRANGIQIEYETFGDRSCPPLLLIMGFGGQMILWDDEFCRQLAQRDLLVIRFDNRDVGLSSKLDGWGQLNRPGFAGGRGRMRPVSGQPVGG